MRCRLLDARRQGTIRLTPPELPIDIVLHTPGGPVLASEQIAFALKRHQGDVTIFMPHYGAKRRSAQ